MRPPQILARCSFVLFAWVLEAGFQSGIAGPIWFEGARLIVGDGSAPIENSAFLVDGDTFTWIGKPGDRQPPQGAARVDLSGKTVMPTLIDGHNHIGLINEQDGSNTRQTTRARIWSTSSSATRTTASPPR